MKQKLVTFNLISIMEKNFGLKEVKSVNVQCVIAGVSILFSVLSATLGYESLSISMAMIFAIVCVMSCMTRDVMELCDGLMDEDEE